MVRTISHCQLGCCPSSGCPPWLRERRMVFRKECATRQCSAVWLYNRLRRDERLFLVVKRREAQLNHCRPEERALGGSNLISPALSPARHLQLSCVHTMYNQLPLAPWWSTNVLRNRQEVDVDRPHAGVECGNRIKSGSRVRGCSKVCREYPCHS